MTAVIWSETFVDRAKKLATSGSGGRRGVLENPAAPRRAIEIVMVTRTQPTLHDMD
jgi:hypothetical protein